LVNAHPGRHHRCGSAAGLTLAHLLHRSSIESVVVEHRSREYVIERVRAGVLEQATVDLMVAAGVGHRLQREGMRHDGVYVAFKGRDTA
jgi:p-hydroxybenzoate 3-monooxygenase